MHEHIAAGGSTPPFERGDFVLCHSDSFFGKLVRFGQKFRFKGQDACFAHFNHAALLTGNNGDIIEATGKGVIQHNLSKYNTRDFVIVHIEAGEADRQQEIEFAAKALGRRYGWFHIVSAGLSLMTGLKFSFGFDEEVICSGLVAGALERTNATFPRSCTHMTPADLAEYYQIRITNDHTS